MIAPDAAAVAACPSAPRYPSVPAVFIITPRDLPSSTLLRAIKSIANRITFNVPTTLFYEIFKINGYSCEMQFINDKNRFTYTLSTVS